MCDCVLYVCFLMQTGYYIAANDNIRGTFRGCMCVVCFTVDAVLFMFQSKCWLQSKNKEVSHIHSLIRSSI